MEDKMDINLDDMMEKIREKVSDGYDAVVAIGRGGILPGYLAARFLDIPLEIIYLNLRDENHREIRVEPLLTKVFNFNAEGKKILLTDDVSNSGKTFEAAEKYLNGGIITTLVISGKGDISLFGPHDRCIRWPWDTK